MVAADRTASRVPELLRGGRLGPGAVRRKSLVGDPSKAPLARFLASELASQDSRSVEETGARGAMRPPRRMGLASAGCTLRSPW